jgi:hypothetical protein
MQDFLHANQRGFACGTGGSADDRKSEAICFRKQEAVTYKIAFCFTCLEVYLKFLEWKALHPLDANQRGVGRRRFQLGA